MADEAVAACANTARLAADDPDGTNWKDYLAGQLDALRRIRAAIP